MAEILLENIRQITWIEGIAALVGIVSVLYLQAGRIVGYLLGMFSVALYIWICYEAKLYAHMGVNAYYLLINGYGIYHWVGGAQGAPARYGYCRRWEYGVLAIGIPLCFLLLYGLLRNFTDSDIPFWDASTTSFWVAASWLMARKRLENWFGWIVADAVCVPLYFHKGLLLTSVQMFVFLAIAVMGFIHWRRFFLAQEAPSRAP